MKKQLLFLLLCATISLNGLAQASISITSALTTATEIGTSLTINYKYTTSSPAACYIYCGIELLNDWTWVSTVGGDQLDPAPGGTNLTGSFTILIPNNTIPTANLTAPQNYKIKIELKNSSYVWITGEYPPTQLNFTQNLGVDDQNLVDELAIYPNPVADVLSISTSEDLSNAKFSITTTLGETVIQSKNSNTNSIDVSNLSSGVYILSLEKEDKTKQFKFIKK